MARKIDSLTAAAFRMGSAFHLGNTVVTVSGSLVRCYLHGNLIAERDGNKTRFQSCGWDTVTTKARLNACGLDCRIKGGILICNETGEPVPARW